ncbi:MAG TPA: ABC transporter permease subunit [Baekduia sp.]|uniref:ABC transporter permease n=1 Tax=Baekduia sp. TaxID=2600305 RepID=UPI002B8CB0F3|nr:ABC transporter permease subunit [Baekduia sp.]HMJ36555.1 ABC transporter permease subunit [Baekduia sp.]
MTDLSDMTNPVPAVTPGPPAAATAPERSLLSVAADNKWVQRLVVWGALLVVYEIAAVAAGPFYLPTIEKILGGFVDIAQQGRIPTLLSSLEHLAAGFGLAVVVGVPVGLAMGRSPVVDAVVGMYVRGLFVTSLAAVLPLLIMLFDVGFRFRLVVVFLFSVFFIIVNTAAGARAVPEQLITTARSFGVSPLRRFTTVVLPSSLPYVIVGLRLGIANAFTGMVLAELWVSTGTGAVLKGLGQNRQLPEFFAFVLLITALAALATFGLRVAERRLMPWAEEVRNVD